MEAYKDDLFPSEEGANEDWLIYEFFKLELKEIEAILEAISNYKYFNTERKFYERNIEANKSQLDDINNGKTSLKIMLLKGTEEEKKAQLIE